MKASLIAVIIISVFCSSLKGQWEVVHEGYAYRLIDFVSKDVGWMVTEDTILKTIDGGETWIPDPWNLGEYYHGCKYIEAMDFVNDSVGWISMPINPMGGSEEDGLFKTTDGGKSWKICAERDGLILVYASEYVVITDAYSDNLMRSVDGGTTWEDISPAVYLGDPLSMSFIRSDTGIYAYGGGGSSGTEFNRTFDGGRNWQHRILPEFKQFHEIGFIDHSHGYFVAENHSSEYVICITDDAFDTWTVVYETPYPVHNCHFFNSDSCIALMEDPIGLNILKSYDGGLSWFDPISLRLPVSDCVGGISYEITFNNDSDGIFYSRTYYNTTGLLFKSKDHGDKWSRLNLSYPFHDICFMDDQKGFAAGGVYGAMTHFGDILGTTDGGRSWKFVKSRLFTIVNCEFVNDSIGFASNPWRGGICHGDHQFSSNLFQTTDGGVSWNEYIHPFDQFTGFKFLNEQIGFALNDSGIYITNDKGDSWDLLLSSEVTDSLIENPSYFISTTASDENTFWAIAGDRSVIRFTGEGTWEKMELDTEQDLFRIFFKDEYTGWIASGDYWAHWYDPDPPTMFKTEDGGESWYKTDNPYQFRDMFFADSNHGWAVGMDSLRRGVILETTDGGEEWIVQVDSLDAPLNGISYKDGIAWAVGENGLILKKYDSPQTTTIGNQSAFVDQNFTFQISPNPTHSILDIKSEIQGNYTIELLSLNGQLLQVLTVSGTNHQLDLSSFRKGIYFVNIRSKDFVTTRKILKL